MKLDTIYTYFSDYSEENVNKMLSFLDFCQDIVNKNYKTR